MTNKDLEIILKRKFSSYNQITKLFDVKVIMNKNNKFSLNLELKKNGGYGGDNEMPSWFKPFAKTVLEFIDEQRIINAKQAEFNAKQEKFNQFVLNQFKKHGWVK